MCTTGIDMDEDFIEEDRYARLTSPWENRRHQCIRTPELVYHSGLTNLVACQRFVCVLAHEFAHALIARTSGLTVKHITLFIFGGVANMEEDMKRPGVEFRVAVAGPIASFLLAIFAFLLALPLRGTDTPTEAVLD